MKKIKEVLKVATIYSGAIVGAGFASGKEIIEYFTGYGTKGFWGIALSGLLFSLLGYAIIDISCVKKVNSYKDFLSKVFGEILGKIIEWSTVFFMLILFATMISATGAISTQNKIASSETAIIFITIICIITFKFSLKGVIVINSVISPLLVIGGIALGLYSFFEGVSVANIEGTQRIYGKWYIATLIYVSYNIITAISILSTVGKETKNKKLACIGGAVGGVSLGIMGFFINLGLYANFEQIKKAQIPILLLAQRYNFIVEKIFLLLLLAAIYTTAVINGYALIEWLRDKFSIKKGVAIILITVLGFILAHISFSDMVKKVYPLFAYIGGLEAIVILIIFFCIKLEHSLRNFHCKL